MADLAALHNDYDRAARLEPGNADYWHKKGLQALLANQDAAAAEQNLEAAIIRNPYLSRYWIDLATARLALGNLPGQRAAVDRAVQAEPTDPEVRWEAANLYLVYGDQQRGTHELREFLRYSSTQVETAVQMCWHLYPDVNEVLGACVPNRVEAYTALLNILVRRGEWHAAVNAWDRLLALSQPFPLESGLSYVDGLLQHRQVPAAVRTWRELRERDSSLPPADEASLMTNGGFDAISPSSRGFDWRYAPPAHVAVRMDTAEFHRGICSLALAFDGTAVSDLGVFQYVPVKPHTAYVLTAFVRTSEIVSTSGPRIAVVDTVAGRAVALTDDLLGSNPWQEQQLRFRTGPTTDLIVVRLMRAPADTGIDGRVWYDDFRLAEVEEAR